MNNTLGPKVWRAIRRNHSPWCCPCPICRTYRIDAGTALRLAAMMVAVPTGSATAGAMLSVTGPIIALCAGIVAYLWSGRLFRRHRHRLAALRVELSGAAFFGA